MSLTCSLYETHNYNLTIRSFFPKRGNRRKVARYFRSITYYRRELIEPGNGSVKRKSEASVSSKTYKTARANIYCKLLSHNLLGYFI